MQNPGRFRQQIKHLSLGPLGLHRPCLGPRAGELVQRGVRPPDAFGQLRVVRRHQRRVVELESELCGDSREERDRAIGCFRGCVPIKQRLEPPAQV